MTSPSDKRQNPSWMGALVRKPRKLIYYRRTYLTLLPRRVSSSTRQSCMREKRKHCQSWNYIEWLTGRYSDFNQIVHVPCRNVSSQWKTTSSDDQYKTKARVHLMIVPKLHAHERPPFSSTRYCTCMDELEEVWPDVTHSILSGCTCWGGRWVWQSFQENIKREITLIDTI